MTKPRGLVSFPKAGRTWIRLFLHYYWMFTEIEWSDMGVLFRHDDQMDYNKRVVLIRHPCDVMVSYWLHKTVRGKSSATISQFIRGRRNGIPMYNHKYKVWSQREESQLLVRYEDLFDAEAWVQMLELWHIPIYPIEFQLAREKTQFSTIRENLEEISHFPSAWRYMAAEHGKYKVLEPKNPEGHKFRRGKVGGYVDYLGEDDIQWILENFSLGERWESYRQQYIMESEDFHA